MTLEPGLHGQVVRIVGHDDTAEALESGDVALLATPKLVAWCEAATCDAVSDAIAAGTACVGTEVHIEHLAASPVGTQVTAAATLSEAEDRGLIFDVTAHDDAGQVVGRGVVRRALVPRDRLPG